MKKIVTVNHVSMLFNLSAEKVDSFKEYFIKLIKGKLKYEEFWALSDVSFEVERGERIGIIGKNGSGKSTLLKLIAGVLKPTKGYISSNGNIAPLIELGAGFDFELTARENVFLNGAILGYSRKEMEKKYDEIIEFAELKNFEYVPIKNFSSGMLARLGFSIATAHFPDILVVDEILAVGDIAFQRKCFERMEKFTEMGTTIFFVSHSIEDIKRICTRVIWLNNGKIEKDNKPDIVLDSYLKYMK